MRQRFEPITLYSPQRARSVWLGRDLMRKIQDRLLTTERPDPGIKDPIELRPVLSLTCDIDQMVREPNYDSGTTVYAAAVGYKAIWTCPDDEIAEITKFYVNSGDAARTIAVLGVSDDDAATAGFFDEWVSQAGAQSITFNQSVANWQPRTVYPGETLFAYFDANVAGGTASWQIRYIRLKTIEVPL